MTAEQRTLNRRCVGCVYGPRPDTVDMEVADLNLQPGDAQQCHRDQKVRGADARVCRGFIDQHPLGKHIAFLAEDDADEVDYAWEQLHVALHRRELVRMARMVARKVRDGRELLTIKLDGGETEETFKVSEL